MPAQYREYFLPDGFSTDRSRWTLKQARAYFDWFVEQRSERVDYYLNFFNEGFQDFGENDIKRLSQKLYKKISEEEFWFVQEVKVKTPHGVRVETVRALSDSAIPIASDFGILFSFILEKNIPGLNWRISKGSKKTSHYNSPVLFGFQKGQSQAEYDPIHYGISKSSVMLNFDSLDEWSSFFKTIRVMWNRRTPTLSELLERKRQGKTTDIEEVQKENGWI